jgi:hypothetical protein
MFQYEYVDNSWSTPRWSRGYIKADGTVISSFSPFDRLQAVDFVADSKNYLVVAISHSDGDGYDNTIIAGKGLGLIRTSDCKLIFVDHLCAPTQSIRFDEQEVKFYVSQGNGTELIYTIEQ